MTVGLGTDGAASNNSFDMFGGMKVAALLQKAIFADPSALPSREVLEMAAIRGAEALGLEEKVGSLKVGKRADIVLIDFKKPNLVPLHDLCAGLTYFAHGCHVNGMIVDGEVVMENREVKTLDEKAVIEEAQDAAFSLLER